MADTPESTPLGELVRRWYALLASGVALVVGAAFGLVAASAGTGVIAFLIAYGVLLVGFYVPPLRGWPSENADE